jgi:hypothetical protein
VGNVCPVNKFSLGAKRFADDEEAELEVQKWRDNSEKATMLQISTHW